MNIKIQLSSPIEEWSILADKYEDIMYDNVVDIIRNTIIKFKQRFKDKSPYYPISKEYTWSSINTESESYIKQEILNLIPSRFRGEQYLPHSFIGCNVRGYSSKEHAWEALLIAWIEYETLYHSRI